MKFHKLWIDGYGRFGGKEIDLAPGLQIVAGPNEQGKSTLRHFVSDMLYGQKRTAAQRVYDDSNELRYPWSTENGYGGRMIYVLDSGQEIEVQRSFDRKSESIRIFDRTNAREITNEFGTLRNRESTFAEKHLGMTKDVYLGMATISHVTLDELGDKQALAQIREKLLSLADSGSGESSAEAALNWLRDRITAVGQQNARTKPLPLARNRLLELQKEYEESLALRGEIANVELDRQSVQREIVTLEKRRSALTREMSVHEKRDRAERYRKALELKARIDALDAQRTALGDVEDFPVERGPEFRRTATLLETARLQAERTAGELKRLEGQLEEELDRLGPDRALVVDELDPEFEGQLSELEAKIRRLVDRIEEVEETYATAGTRQDEAQGELARLPDFSRLAADPVEWLTQLASSFGIALRTREDENSKLIRLEAAVKAKREGLQFAEELFIDVDDFTQSVREYHERLHSFEEHIHESEAEANALSAQAEELQSRVPGSALVAVGGITMALIFAGSALYTGNTGIYLPAVCVGLMGAWFGGNAAWARRSIRTVVGRLEEIEREQAYFRETDKRDRSFIESLMREADCETVRELEALYDRYREDTSQLQLLEEQLAEQILGAQEARERVSRLYDRIRGTFGKAGETIEVEEDVQGAAMRAISRYQEYRDAKRRYNESKDVIERRAKEIERLQGELDGLREEELSISLEVRRVLRENGYADEQKFETALKAMRGYRIRTAQVRQKRHQLDVLEGAVKRLREEAEEEAQTLTRHEESLRTLLAEAGVDSLDGFETRAAQAEEARQLVKEHAALEEQLSAYVRGDGLDALKAAVEADGPLPKYSSRSKEEFQRDLERLNQDLDAARKQEHLLHLAITERSAGSRTLNEVDEERAAVGKQVRELELELQAASYAMAILEEVTRERHSKIAPQLAAQASLYLKQITDGFYDELLINRDMQISVRIPQTKAINSDPENNLSKGTVDQIYLALRLAMVQTMSDGSERIPMLLDDPFANYDDERLARAMKLLAGIGKQNQVLLFTCREDVVRAAKAVKSPVFYL